MKSNDKRAGLVFDGSDESLARAVEAYNKPLIFFINSLVRNLSDAEDIAADTFLELLLSKPRFREASSFKTYLFTCARNNAIDHIRKKARAKTLLCGEDEVSGYDADASSGLEDELLRSERDRAIHRALQTLSDDYREVLILLYFEDISLDDAAIIMKKSKKQMYNLSFRARQAIKEALEKEGF